MSKNAKNARKHAAARAVSANRKKGNKGAAQTKKVHTKRATWYAIKDGKFQPRGRQAVVAEEATE